MPLLSWLREFWEQFTPPKLKPTASWTPPDGSPGADRWYVIVRNAFKFPSELPGLRPVSEVWGYGSRYHQGGGWIELVSAEEVDLARFIKTLAFALPDDLFPDRGRKHSPYPRLTICLDLRLCDFSLARFGRPDVVVAIGRFVHEYWREFVNYPELDKDGRWNHPILDYEFRYGSYGQLKFGACFYRWPELITWPQSFILKYVPDAEDYLEAIQVVRDLASLRVPKVSEIPRLTEPDSVRLPPVPSSERKRASYERRLDGSSLDAVYTLLDRILDPIHDVALSVFQMSLDQLAGQACPLFEDNKRLATFVLERIDRYGFRLFLERRGELIQVRVDAKIAQASLDANPTGPAALAGLFTIRTNDPRRGRTVPISSVAIFPQLIAARDLDQANRIWEARKSGDGLIADPD